MLCFIGFSLFNLDFIFTTKYIVVKVKPNKENPILGVPL